MPGVVVLILIVVTTILVAWFCSEFQNSRGLRISLGIVAIGCCFAVAYAVGCLSELNYNAWYGGASKELTHTMLVEIEDGQMERVLKVLRALDRQFQPTYENRANYQELIATAVSQMRGEVEIEPDSKWNVTPFSRETWSGHWESDNGFWLVIDRYSSEIQRSGDGILRIKNASFSDDFRVLNFTDSTGTTHELSLKNKYEADWNWRSNSDEIRREAKSLHKLIRATSDQRRVTSQAQ